MMASLSTKISELACFFGASETKKDQMEVSCAAASKDGALFATGVNKTLKIYNFKDTLARSPSFINSPSLYSRSDGRVTSIEFEKFGHNVACGHSTGSINILDTAISCQKYTIPAHKGSISSLAYTSCGRFLVSGSCENKVKIWYSSDMHNVFNFDTKDQISSVCTHPQHPHLLAYSIRDTICYIDMRMPRELLQSLCVQIDVKTALFVSNAEIVLLSASGRVTLCNIESLNCCVRSFEDPLNCQFVRAFHVQNNLILCGCQSSDLRTYHKDWSMPQSLYHIQHKSPCQSNEGLPPEIISFLGTVTDWNPAQPQPLQTISSVCWINDKHFLAATNTGYVSIFIQSEQQK